MGFRKFIANKLHFVFLLALFAMQATAGSTTSLGGGATLPACANNGYVLTYSTGTGEYACAAAPGASGGDAWTDAVDSDLLPTGNDNTYDLGSAAASFADAWIDGTATIGTATITSGTVGGSAIATAASTTAFTNKSYDADGTGNSITNIENADIKTAAAIDAAKIADGSVSSTEFQYIGSLTSDAQTQIDGKAPSDGDGIVEDICGHIETPDNKAYWLKINAPYPFTVNSITTDVDSGTASGALEIEGTPVTGCTSSDISISSTEATDTCSSGNTVSVGNDLEFVISSNSSAAELRFCVKITRD